jgi:hypothetical protein
MKLLILSGARSGKDTCAEYWRDNFGMTFKSSSEMAAEIFIYDLLKYKYYYKTFKECFEDRVNHRKEWHDLITDYNKDDRARLAKEISSNQDCYVGMRCDKEIEECMRIGLFDLIIWIDASERVEAESNDSFKIDIGVADLIIKNNGTLEEFETKLHKIGKALFT